MQWWVYLLGILGAMILGAFLASLVFLIHSKLQSRKLKKNLPKSKEEITAYLKQQVVKDFMANPGNVNVTDKKEAEEDERQRFNKYREFEKLRRLNQGKQTAGFDNKPSERRNIPSKFDFGDTATESKPKRDISFD